MADGIDASIALNAGRPVAQPYNALTALGQSTQTTNAMLQNRLIQGSVPPGVVRDRINALPDGALGGKQVVISTGLSNSGTPQQRQADLAVVQQQVDAARAKGAASVVLAGVGDARFPGINAGLADIATRNNVALPRDVGGSAGRAAAGG